MAGAVGAPLAGVGAGEGTDGAAVVAALGCAAGDTPGGGGGLVDTAAGDGGGDCGAAVKVDVAAGKLIGVLLDAVTERLLGDVTVDVAVTGLRIGGCVGNTVVAVMPCASALSGHTAPAVMATVIASEATAQAAATAVGQKGFSLAGMAQRCIIFAPSPPHLGRRAVGLWLCLHWQRARPRCTDLAR